MNLALRIAELSPAKRALLELALDDYHGAAADATVPRQTARDRGPLSFAQQRLWFLDQLHPGRADYSIPSLLELRGPLDLDALRAALNAIVARHAALRSTFAASDTEAVQCVAAELTLPLPLIDLSAEPQAASAMQRRIKMEMARPFDLTNGPLITATLFYKAADHHYLLVNLHHIVADGWSLTVFNRELGEFYNACRAGRTAALSELALQYLDYAVWQRGQTSIIEQQLDYWRTRLDDAPLALDLPLDHPRPAVQSFDGARHNLLIAPPLSAALKALAKRENATLFMVLLAALHVLLHRHSGQDDILVGTPIAGRNRIEFEGLIGLFVNSLVMRARPAPAQRFRAFLAEVRETVLAAFTHQDLPFERLVEALAPQRDMSRNPVFQVMFSLQSGDPALPDMQEILVTRHDLGGSRAKFDLTLFVSESADGLQVTFNYATDLFEATTIARMAGHYANLLAAVATDADQTLARLPLLTAQEHAHLADWNRNDRPFPRDAGLAQLFETEVRRAPDAIAAMMGDAQISYGELNRAANRLAHHLGTHGVGAGALVGLCMERSLDALVAMLAIVKAGAAYVPLDPSYPAERLALMIADARPAALITVPAHLQALDGRDAAVICLDRDRAAIQREADHDPPAAADGGSLAYVMYTSGSTGTPKGVCVPQRAVTRLVRNTDYVFLGRDDVVAHAASIAFDAATFEIWGALLNGGRLLVVPKEVLLAQDAFTALWRAHGVTTLFLTTALFNQMIARDPAAFGGLRQLLVGGEACNADRVRACLQYGKPQRLLNAYGPTETTTFATWYEVQELAADAAGVPIGRPIANTRCYVFDGERQPVPIGVTGELYIGGPGVALGYLRRPELSAEKFVAHPDGSGEMLYRSGDLVRYRRDGVLEFVGRGDDQIKLRGFRIEPGEIDAALKRHADVLDSLTVLRNDGAGDPCLVAYVTAAPGRAALEPALRDYLALRLPPQMVPAAVVVLSALPLTPNGKVDRKALPAPHAPGRQNGDGAEPRNKLELHLVKIWEDVMGKAPIGIRDNFFALGGHSLLAVRLFDRIERHFGKKLPLDTLWFNGATIETLAALLEREQENVLWPELVQIKAGGAKVPLFCVHTMGGNLFHYYEFARALSPELPIYGLQARGAYGSQAPRHSVADIAADCIAAMRQRQPSGPYRIAGFSSGGIVALEMAQQLAAAGERVAHLILLDCHTPWATQKGRIRRRLNKLRTLEGLRQYQERLYHRVFHTFGLRRLRRLRTIGESHRWAHWSYKPQPYAGHIDLFVAAESAKHATDPLLGWGKIAIGTLKVHVVPGTHAQIVKQPDVVVLADMLQRILDRDDE